ncbi:zinc-ribbon domain-containing protein [Candidatus Galacturonibacter soehngenii]|nr:zinc-ribbon domain-containing protein [Candidatus Galacturonibacter soehngenii]
MDFFEKLGETISTKSKDVAKKAKEVAEVVSLNAKISTQEDIIKKTYAQIGQKYYEKYKEDSFNEFGAEFDSINHAMEEIKRLQDEIQTIKNTKICPKCQEEVPTDSAFCSKCGAQFEAESQESEKAPQEDRNNDKVSEEEQPEVNDDVII